MLLLCSFHTMVPCVCGVEEEVSQGRTGHDRTMEPSGATIVRIGATMD